MAGVTAEQVIAAAEAIAAQGDRPSVRAIRDRLETGSFNTIQRYLSEWRETRPQITQEIGRASCRERVCIQV